jgi:homospermidine synthase
MKSKSERCLKKFLRFFPGGFADPKYFSWERGYKWNAHLSWKKELGKDEYTSLLKKGDYKEIATRAVKIETKTNLLFSFEKMALRDAVRERAGAKDFAEGLYEYIHGNDSPEKRFSQFAERLSNLPVKQTRVHTWPLQTVFGFIANPKEHIFLKPRVTQRAAENYGYDFHYASKPNWETYQSLKKFAGQIRKEHPQLKPKDYIDLQSFIWVMGSDEY